MKKILLILSLLILSVVLVNAQEDTSTLVKEQVKCVFANSDATQKCYTDDGKFGCSGVGTCVADVSGEKGDKQTWKSSCGGYAYTVIDGDNDYAEFKCATESGKPYCGAVGTKSEGWYHFNNELIRWDDCAKCDAVCDAVGTKSEGWYSSCDKKLIKYDDCSVDEVPITVTEQVKCVFKNSKTVQKCYSAEDNSRFSCSGIETCVMDVKGNKGEKLTWKSSCGGYDYTVIDGESDYAEFSCISETEVTEEIISGKGFRYAYWQCQNKEEQKQGSDTSCKSSETWQKYAKDYCEKKCNEDGSKCGLNSFSVADECYLEFEKEEVVFVPSVVEEEKKQEEELIKETKEEILICKDSCPLDGKCYPFGYRKSKMFCSDDGSFVEQLKGESSCENNFECSTNLCIDSKCVSEGFLKKVMNWFSKLFGG
tara:strand:- start:1739 stop:3010 length:1272 start_codon:yes stop_codon:yes gene_type:complete